MCAYRDGWFTLLAGVLEAMATCAKLRCAWDDALACRLELTVISVSEPLSQRLEIAHRILQKSFTPVSTSSTATRPQERPQMKFRVQAAPWVGRSNLSTSHLAAIPTPTAADGLCARSWLNVIHIAASCMHSGRQSGDVIVAVALRNMLPVAPETPPLTLPLSNVKIVMASDIGFTCMDAAPVTLRRPSAAGAARESTDAGLPFTASRQSSLRGSRQLVRQRSDKGSTEEIDAMLKHHAQYSPTIPDDTQVACGQQHLWPGEWAVHATRLYPGSAERISMYSVIIELGNGACCVEYMLEDLDKESPGQVVVCGTSSQRLSWGLVGRDAPFGRLATALEPGRLTMALKQSMLPTVNVSLSEPVGLLHVGSAVCVTACLTSTGVSSAQRTLRVATRFSVPRPGVVESESPVALLVGDSLTSAQPLPSEGVKLPILAKGVARTANIWVVGIGRCEGDLEVGIEGASADALQRWHFEVLDPLLFEVSLACESGSHSIVRMEKPEAAPTRADLLGYIPAGAFVAFINTFQSTFLCCL
jgi:hypothetical protein